MISPLHLRHHCAAYGTIVKISLPAPFPLFHTFSFSPFFCSHDWISSPPYLLLFLFPTNYLFIHRGLKGRRLRSEFLKHILHSSFRLCQHCFVFFQNVFNWSDVRVLRL